MATIWQHSESFESTNLHMLEKEILCDVTLLAGTTKEPVKCHKFILASRSPVFYTMFCGSLAEASGTVEIRDIQAPCLKQFVRFLYTSECSITAENVLELLYTAKKYDTSGIQKQCSAFLEDNMSTENVCTLLTYAVQFGAADLQEKCLQFLKQNTKAAIETHDFRKMSNAAMELMLKLGTINCDEVDVYQCCKDWANETCLAKGQDGSDQQLRDALGNLICLIRFPAMSPEVFTKAVASEDILSPQEKLDVYRDIILNTNSSKFVAELRTRNVENVIRFGAFVNNWSYSGKQDGISFRVSETASLESVTCFLPLTTGTTSGPLEVYEEDKNILTQNITLEYQSGCKTKEIELSKRLFLRPGQTYSICQKLTGAKTYSGSHGKQCITVNGATVTFMDLNDKVGRSDNNTTTSRGQFYGISLRCKGRLSK